MVHDPRVPDEAAQNPAPTPGEPQDTAPLDPIAVRLEVPARTFIKAILAILATILILRFLGQITVVIIMIILALMIASVLNPMVGWLERHKIGRGVASLISIVVVVLGILAFLGIILPPLVIQAIELIQNAPEVIARFQRILIRYPDAYQALENAAFRLRQQPMLLVSGFLRIGTNTASAIFGGVLILTLALYFLIDQEKIRRTLLQHVPERYRDRLDRTITGVSRVIRAYFTGQVIVSSIFAIYTFVLLTILGVPYATILAAMAFFLDAIPNIGATLATIIPAGVALSTRSLTAMIILVIAIMVYQQVENNFISPRILGGRLEIPPVLTLIAILVGGAVFGIVGIILAVPLAGTLPIIDRLWITYGERRPDGES